MSDHHPPRLEGCQLPPCAEIERGDRIEARPDGGVRLVDDLRLVDDALRRSLEPRGHFGVDALHDVLEVFASQGAVHEDCAANLYSDGYALQSLARRTHIAYTVRG
jgi:hypothetical protein